MLNSLMAHRWAPLFIGVAVLAVYAAGLDNGFHYDDYHSLVENPHIRTLRSVPSFFIDPSTFSVDPQRAMPRPLLLLSYALQYRIHGYAPWGYHVVNLGFHVLCTWLVYVLARQLGSTRAAAGLACALFGLYPLNSETVDYISSRSESLAAAGILGALILYLRARAQAKPVLLVLSVIAFMAALLSKSSAVVLPAMLLVAEVQAARSTSPGRLLPRLRSLAPYAAVAAAFLVLQRTWLAHSLGNPVRPPSIQLWTQLKAAVYYLKLATLPVALSVEHGFQVADGPLDPAVLAAAALLAAGGWALYVRGGRPALLGIWAALALLPSSLVPLNVLVNEHRLYLPLAFLAVMMGNGAGSLLQRRRGWAVGSWLLVLAVLTQLRTGVWRDELSLWRDAVAKAPGSYRAHMHLGGALEQTGKVDLAVAEYRRAAALAPEAVEPRYNLANGLRDLGDRQGAEVAYRTALRQAPGFVPALVNLASLYMDAGRLDSADSLLTRALRVRPDAAGMYQQLGLLRRKQHRPQAARSALEQALQLDPTLVQAHYNLGNLLFAQGDYGGAVEAYGRALQLRPDYAAAYLNLGDLHLQLGEYGAAVQVLSRGVRTASGEPRLWLALGRAQEATGHLLQARTSYARYLRECGVNGDPRGVIRAHVQQLDAAVGKPR